MRRYRKYSRRRRGNILVLSAFMMVAMIGMLAFAVDIGYLTTARTEMQRAADAAAMAAAWELIDDEAMNGSPDLTDEVAAARTSAYAFAGKNAVCTKNPTVDMNTSNNEAGGVVVGHISNPFDSTCPMTYSNPQNFNAVQVRVRRTELENGKVPLFFARVFGYDSMASETEATAALLNNFGGFKSPNGGTGNLGILPFALDEDTWNGMLDGGGSDVWRWNDDGTVSSGADGLREINLYPQGTGSPGNRGTVDIGSCNNSTADIARQIVEGISPEDLDHIGGELKLDDNGELELNGDTGISAGVKDELASIKGQPRIIPIFNSVVGPGNNAQYTIVAFVGVRIMNVKLTGSMSSKQVIIQPAKMVTQGGIPGGESQTSYYIYSPVWLVR